METFTDAQINEYKNSGARICPYCKSEKIVAGQADFDDVSAWRNIACHSCDKEWTESFELVFIEPLYE